MIAPDAGEGKIKMMSSKNGIISRSSKAHPCEICGGDHKCSSTSDGLLICGRPPHQPPVGYLDLGAAKGDEQFHLYRKERDKCAPHQRKRAPQQLDWTAKAQALAHALTPDARDELAAILGLPAVALASLPLLGYSARGFHDGRTNEPCWTFPEMDAHGRVVGILCRYRDGSKKAMAGSSRGLIIPNGWKDRDGPIFSPEGPSDTLTLIALGQSAIGRPNNTAGAELLAELLRGVDRPIVPVGEYDPKATGKWPGREGAEKIAGKLGGLLGRPVSWVLPPAGAKDIREWAVAQSLPTDCADAWADASDRLLEDLRARFIEAPLVGTAANDLEDGSATDVGIVLSTVQPEQVDWLWPGRIPLGKLTILDGDPGLGKSVLTTELAARVSRGMMMPEGEVGAVQEPAGVVLLSAEDGLADTIVPRLVAAGADLSRIMAMTTLKNGQSERLPEFPRDADHVRAAVEQMQARLVIVDPLTAYLGAEINSHRDADCRRALWPLARLATDTGAGVVVVRHLNKAAAASPLYRGGGSIGIIGAARSGMLLARDPDNPDRRVLASTKCNLAKLPPSLSFALEPAPNGSLRIVWGGASKHTAETLLAVPGDYPDRDAVQEAIDVLRALLSAGPRKATEVMAEAKEAGVKERTLLRAKAKLGVQSKLIGFGGEWYWQLPTGDCQGGQLAGSGRNKGASTGEPVVLSVFHPEIATPSENAKP